MNDKNNLTEGVVWKKLLGFFFPILLGLLFQQLYNTVDAVIVGRYVSSAAIAAVGGSAALITNTVIGFFVGLNSGATVLIAQKFGAKDYAGLRAALHTALTASLIIGFLVSVSSLLFAPWALRITNNPEDIMEPASAYLRIYFIGAIPLLVFNLIQSTLQSIGDSRRPLCYLIISCLTNIALDYLFVAVLHLGVSGVAWASVISMALCAALGILHLLRTDGPHRLLLSELGIDFGILPAILRIGIPAGLQGTMYSLSNLIIQTTINSFGTAVVAAWAATGKLDGFYWVTSSAFGVALCAFVGQCYGAGMRERMNASIRTCLVIYSVVTFAMSALIIAVARPVCGIFLDTQEVVDLTVRFIWYFVPFYILWVGIEVCSACFRGTGETLIPMIITMVGTCLLRVFWMLVVVPVWHTLFAVSIIYAISWAFTLFAMLVYFFFGWRRRMNLHFTQKQTDI